MNLHTLSKLFSYKDIFSWTLRLRNLPCWRYFFIFNQISKFNKKYQKILKFTVCFLLISINCLGEAYIPPKCSAVL